jgi:two-component system response regulator HupR/HoxA
VVDLRPFRSLHSIILIHELLRRWWGLELAFADAKGYVLDHAEGKIFPSQNEFCRLALFSKEGFRRCNESVKIIGDRLRTGRAGPPSSSRSRTPTPRRRSGRSPSGHSSRI